MPHSVENAVASEAKKMEGDSSSKLLQSADSNVMSLMTMIQLLIEKQRRKLKNNLGKAVRIAGSGRTDVGTYRGCASAPV